MTQTPTCLRCGWDGPGVKKTIVEYDDPVDVQVSIPIDSSLTAFENRTVPGRYGVEWRCHDKLACDIRLDALTPKPPKPVVLDPEPEPEPEPPARVVEPVSAAQADELPSWL